METLFEEENDESEFFGFSIVRCDSDETLMESSHISESEENGNILLRDPLEALFESEGEESDFLGFSNSSEHFTGHSEDVSISNISTIVDSDDTSV